MSSIFKRHSQADGYYPPIPVYIPVQKTAEEIKADGDEMVAKMKARFPGNFKKAPAPIVQLPVWPDAARGVPNTIIRSALFGINNKRKIFKNRTLIASTSDFEVAFKGEGLNQTDLDLWLVLLHLARLQALGNAIEVTGKDLLKALRRRYGSTQYEQLNSDLMRLIGGVTEIKEIKTNRSFMGGLVQTVARDDITRHYTIKIDPLIMNLFADGYTLIDNGMRKALGRKNLAKWLQGFYFTHAKPYPIKVQTLHEMSGSADVLRNFRTELKPALNTLIKVGSVSSFCITEDDLVVVETVPSSTQKRHITRKKLSTNR